MPKHRKILKKDSTNVEREAFDLDSDDLSRATGNSSVFAEKPFEVAKFGVSLKPESV